MRCGWSSLRGLFGLAVIWLVMEPRPADAAIRYCLPIVVGAEQTATTEAESKRLALASWMQRASIFGAQYAGWLTANSKSLSCRRSAGPDGKQDGKQGGKKDTNVGFICQARAAPCTISLVPVPPKLAPGARPPGGKAIDA